MNLARILFAAVIGSSLTLGAFVAIGSEEAIPQNTEFSSIFSARQQILRSLTSPDPDPDIFDGSQFEKPEESPMVVINNQRPEEGELAEYDSTGDAQQAGAESASEEESAEQAEAGGGAAAAAAQEFGDEAEKVSDATDPSAIGAQLDEEKEIEEEAAAAAMAGGEDGEAGGAAGEGGEDSELAAAAAEAAGEAAEALRREPTKVTFGDESSKIDLPDQAVETGVIGQGEPSEEDDGREAAREEQQEAREMSGRNVFRPEGVEQGETLPGDL